MNFLLRNTDRAAERWLQASMVLPGYGKELDGDCYNAARRGNGICPSNPPPLHHLSHLDSSSTLSRSSSSTLLHLWSPLSYALLHLSQHLSRTCHSTYHSPIKHTFALSKHILHTLLQPFDHLSHAYYHYLLHTRSHLLSTLLHLVVTAHVRTPTSHTLSYP